MRTTISVTGTEVLASVLGTASVTMLAVNTYLTDSENLSQWSVVTAAAVVTVLLVGYARHREHDEHLEQLGDEVHQLRAAVERTAQLMESSTDKVQPIHQAGPRQTRGS